ncbi:MAG: hypothetical protein Q4B58_01590 [Bacteroidales bacterium]|nr:hypothetical protein [Bacteroidales bacterium]
MENCYYLCAAIFQRGEMFSLRFDDAKIQNMWQTIIISIGIISICFVFLAIGMIISKKRTFPKTHVSQNKALRKKGIHCVQTQDYEERHRKGLYD